MCRGNAVHEDHDNYIILITLLPAVLFIGLYATWRSAGEPSLAVPGLPVPNLSLPVIPDLQPYIPSAVTSWIRNIQRNGDTILPAVALGVFMGLVGMGALIDLVRKTWRFAASYFQSGVEDPPEDVISGDVAAEAAVAEDLAQAAL
jgi:hypothetical protein